MEEKQARRHRVMEEGAMATAVLGAFRGLILERQQEVVSQLVATYRGREAAGMVYIGMAAELSALDGLLSNLESTVRRGEVAAEKEMRYGTRSGTHQPPA